MGANAFHAETVLPIVKWALTFDGMRSVDKI